MSEAPQPWLAGEGPQDANKRHAPATLRNRDAIIDVLRTVLPERGIALEVASGSGEHVAAFAAAFPRLDWQPSDPDRAALRSIAAWRAEAALPNVAPPVLLDASDEIWPVARAHAVLCINMVHISPWTATVGLFRGSANVLRAGAPLIIYGPYLEDDVEPAPSNLAFDRSLKGRNPEWGLRNVADLDRVAADFGFGREHRLEMPANNLILIYRQG